MDNNGNSYDYGNYGSGRSSSGQVPANQEKSDSSASTPYSYGQNSDDRYSRDFSRNNIQGQDPYSDRKGFYNAGNDPYARGGSDIDNRDYNFAEGSYDSRNYNYAAGRYENRGYNYSGRGETSQNYMSMADWIITLLIGVIPFVNLIMLLIWSFAGSAPVEKQRYARACLILMIIGIILLTFFTAAFAPAFLSELEELEAIQSF